MSEIKLIECPRDALQGYPIFIDTNKKIDYLNSLLKIGFHTLDCGSFVSKKMVPQMSDTSEVLKAIDLEGIKTKILVIVANERGAIEASKYDNIDYFGYPFSVSENFQIRNTNKTIHESLHVLLKIIEIANKSNKEVITYLSMGFGNPYGDPWSVEIILECIYKFKLLGIKTISLSDTIGVSKNDQIGKLFKSLNKDFKEIEFGAHFHALPDEWFNKINSAYLSGCRRFDGAIMGWGGCPMASNLLIGNIPTEKLISYFNSLGEDLYLNFIAFESAYNNFKSLIHV